MSHYTSDFARLIRRQGYRLTPQRQLILDAICELGAHVTPEAIYQRVAERAPAVNRATVYRNLDFLCEQRLVVAAHIGRETVYEIARAEPHHHLICRRCNKVLTLPHAGVQEFFQALQRRYSFTVDMDHLTLFGLCANCRSGNHP